MKRNLFILFLITVFCFASSNTNTADAKKKKEKKEFVWQKPEPSGDQTIDEYLNSCDVLYNKIKDCSNDVSQYKYYDIPFDFAGKKYKMVYMQNPATKQLLSYGMGRWQVAEAIKTSSLIVLDATNLSLQTANATLSLPNLGLKAIKYTKYVKNGGPKIISKGIKEIGHLKNICQQTMRSYSLVKAQAIQSENLSQELSSFVKKSWNLDDKKFEKWYNKYIFVMEVNEVSAEGVEVEIVQKTQEEIDSQFQESISSLTASTELDLPEGQADNIDEEELLKL